MTSKTCSFCKYFAATETSIESTDIASMGGECRFNPTPITKRPSDWCGQYQSRTSVNEAYTFKGILKG